MAEQWIEASKALELTGSTFALCSRLHAGLIRSRARRAVIDSKEGDDVLIPNTFWWAEGHEALIQNWVNGDFETWTDNKHHWKFFGTTFALSGVLEMLPIEQRALVARSLSAAGNSAWVTAREARRFAYETAGLNPQIAGRALIEQARMGFISAKAVLVQGADTPSSANHWEEREWDVASWFWLNFTDEMSSAQDWDVGRFNGHGRGPNALRKVTLTGVHFLRVSLDALLPIASENAPSILTKNAGGRPPAAFADDLMCAIWTLIYQGDLEPKNQAAVERAMLDWASVNGQKLGNTAAREKARKVFQAIGADVGNPAA